MQEARGYSRSGAVGMMMAAAAVALVPSSGLAQETAAEIDADVQHSFGLTFSPIHLALPIGEVTAEYRLADKMGVAVVLGFGRITSETKTSTTTIENSYTAIEGGAQFRYYVLGTFIHGMQLGAEALYLHLNRDASETIAASGEGLAIGPFVGYKIATNIGFTFDAQLGFEYLALRAKASAGQASASADDSAIVPLLNLNVGWSF